MQQLGETNQDLDYILFSDFLKFNSDLSIQNSDLQRKRYQHIKNNINERLEEIKSLR